MPSSIPSLTRRHLLGLAGFATLMLRYPIASHAADAPFPFTLTDAEWKQKLPPAAYKVLRKHGTERPFTSPLNDEHRAGSFFCAGCETQKLFESAHKYDSGTGWPSFYQPASPNAIGTTTDTILLYPRTEVHCANCGSHLGHVFNDGPKPTGLRYCMNGICLIFKPVG